MTRKIPLIAHDLKRLYTGFLLAAVLLFAVCTYDIALTIILLIAAMVIVVDQITGKLRKELLK